MNFIEALKILLAASGHEEWYEFAPAERHVTVIAAQSLIGELVAAYDEVEYQRTLDASLTDVCPICGQQH